MGILGSVAKYGALGLAGLGATAGGAWGALGGDGSPELAAAGAVGGAAAAVGVPAAAIAGTAGAAYAGYKALPYIGSASIGAAKGLGKGVIGMADAAIHASYTMGGTAKFDKAGKIIKYKEFGAGIFEGSAVNTRSRFVNNMMDPVGRVARLGKNLGGLVEYEETKLKWDAKNKAMKETGGGLRLSRQAKTMVGGAAIIGSAWNMLNTFEDSRKGTSDGMVTTATPVIHRPMSGDGGATGDLVFALNKNRRG